MHPRNCAGSSRQPATIWHAPFGSPETAWGLLTPDFVRIHAVHLEQSEIELLAQHACHIAHNLSSNMKLASGIAPVTAMLAAGVNIGIGTDSAASNNRLDMFTEMRSTALLAKVQSARADAVPAWQALEMATLGGAKAWSSASVSVLYRPANSGSDRRILNQASKPALLRPTFASGVLRGTPTSQRCGLAAKRQIMAQRQLSSINVEQIVAKANWWRDKIRNRRVSPAHAAH